MTVRRRTAGWLLLRVLAPLLPFAALFGVLLLILVAVTVVAGQDTQPGPCPGQDPVAVSVSGLPARVGAYSGEQLVNAALIVKAGVPLVSRHGQEIAVMTAMGESGLRVIDHGDKAGPDSRGLFQQRANGWGSYADRMDPTRSATSFYRALLRVPGWEQLPPTLAAHRTQRNADPNHYTRWWPAAQQVVAALSGVAVDPGAVPPPCQADPAPGGSVPVAPGSWVLPAVGRTSSPFGNRPATAVSPAQHHNGQDIAAPCGTPVWAAADGVVVRAGRSSGYGNLIVIDHGGGVVTRYAHSFDPDVLVRVGQRVRAGEQVARVGRFGQATGCHLHLEVLINGAFTDPVPFLAARGVRFP